MLLFRVRLDTICVFLIMILVLHLLTGFANLLHKLNVNAGAIGPKLLYPDYTIQHGGIILGLDGVANSFHHEFCMMIRDISLDCN